MNEDKENYIDDYDDSLYEMCNEYDYGDSVDVEDYEENEKISLQKKLIAIVKANPALWDKKQRSYSGKNFNKDLAWASVADLLEDMSGLDAEKEFYKIRQRYGKERRKMVMSLKGKSGQGAQPTYIPTWELYDLCDSFLRQAVVPRKTSSNYTKKIDESASNYSSNFKIVVPKNVKVPHVITSTQVSSDNWTSDFSSLSSHETSSESTTESPRTLFQSPTQEAQLRFKKQSQKSEKPNVIQEIRTMSQAKTVPPPDTFNKKKRKINDDLTEVFIKQSEGINNLAVEVAQALNAKQNTAPVPTAPVTAAAIDPMLGAIQMALTNVKDINKFKCMLDILQFINEKYLKNDD